MRHRAKKATCARLAASLAILVGYCSVAGEPDSRCPTAEGQQPLQSLVENGVVKGIGRLNPEGLRRIIVPTDAKIVRAKTQTIELHVIKMLGFAGQPPRPMRIVDWPSHIGVMQRRNSDTLELATFGSWDSHIEGSASVALEIRVPQKLRVVPRTRAIEPVGTGVEAEDSSWLREMSEGCGSYWYARPYPLSGWSVVPLSETATVTGWW